MWSPGLDRQAGGGQAAVDQVGPVLDLLQLALDDADQAVHGGGGEVGDGPLEQRPDALGRIEVRRVRGQPVDAQPFPVLLGEVRQVRRQVDVEVIPVLCPAVLCGRRRVVSGVAAGGRLGGAAAGHIMLRPERLLPLPPGTERKLSRCWRATSSSLRRPAGSGPAGSARRSSAMPAGYLSRAIAPGRCCATSRRWWRSGSSPACAAPRPWPTCPLTSTISSPCGWPRTAVAGMPLPKSAVRSSRCWR